MVLQRQDIEPAAEEETLRKQIIPVELGQYNGYVKSSVSIGKVFKLCQENATTGNSGSPPRDWFLKEKSWSRRYPTSSMRRAAPHARATALRYFFPSGILSIAAKNRTRVVRSRSQGITTATQQPAPRGEGARACQRERHTIAAIFALLLGRP